VNTPFGRAVVDKLDKAERRSSIPCNYVKLNSLVTFEVDGRAALSRILVHWDKFRVPRLHLSLHTPWGMTLLGMKAGEEAIVDWGGGVPEKIKIVSVIPQPVALAPPPVRSHQHTRSPDPLEQRR
jgi:hypothetical protein